MAAGLASFIKYLGHSDFVIKSIVTGVNGAQEEHFQAIRINKAEDYIALRNGKRQLWINLQKLKPEIGDFISFNDIESYKNVYIDLDCEKPDGMKNFAATEEERAKALSQLPILVGWLQSHDLRCGLALHTGNGAGMVLPIPETKAEPVFIAKLATFLKMVQADIPCTDPAMFDPPRVMGIPGTINAKLEMEGRKNQVRAIVGDIPERVEDQALLSLIQSMVPDPDALTKWSKKYNELQAPPKGDKDIFNATGQPPQIIEKINGLPKNADSVIDRLNSILTYHTSLKDLLGGKIDKFGGDRSRAEYSACGSLINAGFTDPEIDHIMQHVSKIGKWQEEGEHYRFEMTLGKLREAEAAKEEPTGPTVIDAFRAMLEHDSEVKTDKDGSTWEWRMQKPRIKVVVKSGKMSQKAEEKAHKFLGQYKKILKTFGIDYDNLFPLAPKGNKEEFSPEIKAKALGILKNGNPVQYVADACGRLVLGAEAAFKKLTCCISVQNIRQSAGLHPKFNGESGGGKTFISYTFAHHLPKESVIKGSMSAKAGFYHHDGNRVLRLLDDYQAGNEDLDTVIKQTTSEFHEHYQHRTLIKQIAAILEIGSEQTWLITSVDASQDIQVLNRQLPINVDDSRDLTKLVNDRTIERYGKAEEQRPIDEMVLVCRAMFQILRDEGIVDVAIPFWQRIHWLDTSNRRNPSIFMDLVVAFTGMNRYQRAKDTEGRYLATEDDFQAAKALFTDKDGEELVKRLTRRERDVIERLVANPSGYTRDELADLLKVAPDRITQILSGQRGSGGLKQKVQLAETKKSETITVCRNTEDEKRITVHKTIYSLKEYDRFTGFDAVVKLEPATVELTKSAKDQLCNQLCTSTDTSEDQLCKISKKEKERKKKEEERDHRELSPSSRENEKEAKFAKSVEPDSESEYIAGAKSGLASLAGSNGVDCGIGPHPRKDEPTPSKKDGSIAVKFNTDYKTDWKDQDGGPIMRQFHEGEIAEVPLERAQAWVKRGVVAMVEACP